ncbi:MAG: sulfite exporter TauE/SafE family protein [Sphingobacteriaceae bacterium]
MNPNYLAFVIGLFGSLHCVGMCGPLAFAVPSVGQGRWKVVLDKFLYQAGRIVSYVLLGILIGLIGRQLWLSGLQQWLSIITGTLIIAAALIRLLGIATLKTSSSLLLKPYYQVFNYAIKHRANHLIIGILNGFLPCGLVYLALTDALNRGTINLSAMYMFWFGLGTLPLMFITSVSVAFAGKLVRQRINRIIPWFMLLLGIWFILRGLELDIPYLSPAKAAETVGCKN